MTHFVTTDQFDKFFNENTENKAAKENEDPLTDIKTVNPGNIGWIQGKVNDEWMKYLWECIEQSKKDDNSWKDRLIGHVETSLSLTDKDNLFFKQCLLPLVYTYEKLYSDGISSDLRSGTTLFTKNSKYTFVLREWWVNFQKAGDFQPLHNHGGIFSFVIWMKIPFDYEEQNKNPIAATANSKKISAFNFTYSDLLGGIREYTYDLNSSDAGKMVFFPAKLNHSVCPFFNCEEDRISISGNICMEYLGEASAGESSKVVNAKSSVGKEELPWMNDDA